MKIYEFDNIEKELIGWLRMYYPNIYTEWRKHIENQLKVKHTSQKLSKK